MGSLYLSLCTCLLVSALYVPSCYRHDAEVVFYVYDGYTFTRAEQRAIRAIAEAAARDARVLLPDLPPRLVIRVNPGRKVIDEIGSSSSHSSPNVVHWTVDPSRSPGVIAIAQAHLRATLFYHFLSLTRAKDRPAETLMDQVVNAGMATAFERDAGGRTYPWARYPGDVAAWVKELIAQPATANRNHWMSRHPDGRRWIGIRAGTYLVDRAMGASGKSAAELKAMSTDDVLRLATLRPE